MHEAWRCYHVFNRGCNREDIFANVSISFTFVATSI
jgi:hypothetical protein